MVKPTYEEFRSLVRKEIEDDLEDFELSAAEIDRYLKSNEKKVKEDYEMYSEEFDKGEITENMFRRGCVKTVSYCLGLMYP